MVLFFLLPPGWNIFIPILVCEMYNTNIVKLSHAMVFIKMRNQVTTNGFVLFEKISLKIAGYFMFDRQYASMADITLIVFLVILW